MLKLVALVALFAGFCWVGTHMQLGSRTLFGHLRAIAQTKESQDLFDGTRESAGPLVDDVRRRIAGAPAPAKKAPTAEEAEDSTDSSKSESAKELAKKDDTKRAKKDETKDQTKPDPKDNKANDDVARATHRHPEGGRSQESLTASERHRLRRLISSAEGASAPR